MNIPSKEELLLKVQNHFGITLKALPNKQIFFQGNLDNGLVLVCTPQSKLYPNGSAWVDLTEIQVSLLKEAKLSILAFRLESGKIYFLRFKALQSYLTDQAMIYNKKEGNHWKLRIWPNEIRVNGNSNICRIKSFELSELESN